jgi:hypothetical protein
MRDKATKLVAPAKVWRRLRAPVVLVLMALAGCFGPPTMHYDIQEYNKQVVSSEQEMLLYNIGRLNRDLPPHFMMLSSVSQTRMFSAGLSFQWIQALSALNPATTIVNKSKTISTTSSNIATGSTWQAGPFTAGTVENPTITFVPIQGQDFALRFETPLTEKFRLFLEDRDWFATDSEIESMVLLFAQSLDLSHGDSDKCPRGLYVNRGPDPQDVHPDETHYYDALSACVKEIVERPPGSELNSVLIDGHHPVPTKTSEDPKAADVVAALSANYEWNKGGKNFALTTPVRIPGWLDYDPDFNPQQPPGPDLDPVVLYRRNLKPIDLVYETPKGFTWTPDGKGGFVLLPDGYGLNHNGRPAKLGKCEAVTCSPGNTCTGKCETGRCDAGYCGPGECTPNKCEPAECYSGECDSDKTRLLYSDKIVDNVWPVTQNYFYVELRRNNNHQSQFANVYNKTAEEACFGGSKSSSEKNNIVCGYFKIGNFLQIMQRLASAACTTKDPDQVEKYCPESIFGVGPDVPSWAEASAPFTYRTRESGEQKEWAWVPAHNPQTERELVMNDPKHLDLAKRDREAFFNLYKLYQMSLVDTSKLVTGAPPITISK